MRCWVAPDTACLLDVCAVVALQILLGRSEKRQLGSRKGNTFSIAHFGDGGGELEPEQEEAAPDAAAAEVAAKDAKTFWAELLPEAAAEHAARAGRKVPEVRPHTAMAAASFQCLQPASPARCSRSCSFRVMHCCHVQLPPALASLCWTHVCVFEGPVLHCVCLCDCVCVQVLGPRRRKAVDYREANMGARAASSSDFTAGDGMEEDGEEGASSKGTKRGAEEDGQQGGSKKAKRRVGLCCWECAAPVLVLLHLMCAS